MFPTILAAVFGFLSLYAFLLRRRVQSSELMSTPVPRDQCGADVLAVFSFCWFAAAFVCATPALEKLLGG